MREAEKRLLEGLSKERIQTHLCRLSALDRLSGSEGEEEAVSYIAGVLREQGVPHTIRSYPVLLSNPLSAELRVRVKGETLELPAKTRSFSGSTGPRPRVGTLRWVDPSALVSDPFLFHLEEDRMETDLRGCVACSPPLNPIQVLHLEKRGAIGSIQVWPGKEELLHEGINGAVWGTPRPEQLRYYTTLPILVISQKRGGELEFLLREGAPVEAELQTEVTTGLRMVPQLEAEIRPGKVEENGGPFVLMGSHLDSWHKGATDNATGNALLLSVLELLHEHAGELAYPVKGVFWSGHSNGRYAGSASYARERFWELRERCVAYINLDMPGLRGATEYRRLASGPELVEAAAEIVEEITGQIGTFTRPVRGWDQSFQNIGVSSFFVWSSTLPDHHPDSTGNSFMSYWWHTEEDTLAYHDPEILFLDGNIYALAAFRMATRPELLFQPERLLEEIERRIQGLVEHGGIGNDGDSHDGARGRGEQSLETKEGRANFFSPLLESLRELRGLWARRNGASLSKAADSGFQSLVRAVKFLNRVYYVEGDCHVQDLALDQEPIPGLSKIKYARDGRLDPLRKEILRTYLMEQRNRIMEIIEFARSELAGKTFFGIE